MKTRLKELFFGGIGGIFIGLFFSMIVSYFYNPAYLPLHPRSPIGHFFLSQHVHVSLIMLYCMLIWASIGLLFSFGTVLFAKDWRLLRATLSHYFLMLFGFLPLATLGGWFPVQISFYISVIIEFSLVYLVIWAASYHIYKKKVEEINQQLQGKA